MHFQDFHTSKIFLSSTSTQHGTDRLSHLRLRRQIWIECLLQESPRVYALELDIALTDEDNDTDMYKRPTDVKFAPARPIDGRDELRDLITATDASRRFGSTCREAREATAFILPNVFEMKANPKQWPGTSQRPHISTGSFRYNAKRDIIGVVSCYSEQLNFARTWTQRGHILPNADIIRHVALDTSMTEDVRISDIWLECGCGKQGCIVCSKDPLLHFLRLFPNLMSFHILQHSTSFTAEDVGSSTVNVGPVSLCDCKSSGQGVNHDWPIFKGMPENSCFVSYTEDGGCSYPELPRLAYDRNQSGSRWPYYDALRHLDIRILRRVNLSET